MSAILDGAERVREGRVTSGPGPGLKRAAGDARLLAGRYVPPAVATSGGAVADSPERRSRGRYRSASATCVHATDIASSRSAIVRATLRTRWYARADSSHRSAADASSSRASLSTGVRVSNQRPDA